MTEAAAWINGWRLLRNERLPPTVMPFWSYDSDSWAWVPKQYGNGVVYGDNPSTLTRDYNYYLRVQSPNVLHPLLTAYGGLPEADIDAIHNDSLRFPDLKSETNRSQAILGDYWKILAEKKLIPRRVAY